MQGDPILEHNLGHLLLHHNTPRVPIKGRVALYWANVILATTRMPELAYSIDTKPPP